MAKQYNPSEIRKRGYKCLLYADNPDHMKVFTRLFRNKSIKNNFVGCWHIQRTDKGAEIVKGTGKKHCHLIFRFDNPRYWSGVLSEFGLEERFCRPIGLEKRSDNIESGLVYLIHANAPDKEQYSLDDLFGSPVLIREAEAAVIRYKMRHVTLSESMLAIRDWVVSQYGKRITPCMFIDWICKTPYVRTAQNPWVRELINDHNWVISQRESENKEAFYAEQSRAWSEWLDRNGWQEII